MVNAFVSRQDQLRQQQQQEEALRRQAEQQALDNQMREQQLAMQREQMTQQASRYADERADLQYNRDRATRTEGVQQREGEFRTVLAPMMNDFQQGLDNDLARYAPTTKDGRPNPGYDRALFEAAQARQKQARKLWANVGLTVGQGQGWEEARGALVSFLGGETPQGTPTQAPPVPAPIAAPQAAPPRIDMQFGPPTPQATTDTPPAQPAPQQQGPQLPQSLPPTVQGVPPSQLAGMDDAILLQKYGQGGVEYARAARAEYTAQRAAQLEKVRSSQVAFWSKAAQNVLEDKDRPATPEQLSAAATVMTLINLPSLTNEQAQQFGAAVQALTPRTLTAATWQSVLDTKDPATILSALRMYQSQAPDVVAGFDATPYATQMNAALDKDAADALQSRAAAGASEAAGRASDASAARTTALLPGEVQAQDDEHAESLSDRDKTAAEVGLITAQTEGEQADTAGTRQDTRNDALDARVKAYDLGIKQVMGWAKTDATVYQLTKTNPEAWARLKADLGVNDAGLTALLQQARYEYGRDLAEEDMEMRLKASQVATDGARRAGIIADTANTVQDTANDAALAPLQRANLAAETADTHSQMRARDAQLQPQLDLLNARIRTEAAAGRNVESLIAERNALLPVKVGEGTARTANLWATVANTRSTINRRDTLLPHEVSAAAQNLKLDREKTAAYIKGAEGKYMVDMAQVQNLTARTALTRAQDPNDPLYNPRITASKPGDPVDALKKRAGVFYTQADQALRQASTLQGQINSLAERAKGVTGVVDVTRLPAEDQTKLRALTAQRDKLFGQAQAARQRGDDVVTNGMKTLPTSTTGAAGTDPYGTKEMGGVQMVTRFPSTRPIPSTFNQDARFHISRVAGRLGIDPNALAAVISFETGGTFNPAAKNPGSSASGLIQFMDATAKGLGTTTAALRAMSFGDQMGYVEKYLGGRGIGPGSSMADVYAAVTGSGYRRGSPGYEQNKVWDANKDGVIEKGEQVLSPAFQSHVRDYFGGTRAAMGPAAPPRTTTTRTTTPPAPKTASFKPQPQLETGLKNALKTGDRSTFDAVWASMLKAGYTEAQLDQILKGTKS